ncbi:MAG TPA: CcmD family protein [Dehalococcoidia bacterium]|nr:CcmD family protein [Dehalococcoidia bacterium]
MENAGYLLAAYTVIWAVVFGYVFYMQRKQKKLQRQIDLLREREEKNSISE